MKDKEKQIEEMATIIDNIENNAYAQEFRWDGVKEVADSEKIAKELLEYYQPKIPKDSVVISKEEYEYLKNNQMPLSPVVLTEKQYLELNHKAYFSSKEMAEKFYDKINESICVFKLENKSEEYKDGYVDAIADICERIDQVAKQFLVLR